MTRQLPHSPLLIPVVFYDVADGDEPPPERLETRQWSVIPQMGSRVCVGQLKGIVQEIDWYDHVKGDGTPITNSPGVWIGLICKDPVDKPETPYQIELCEQIKILAAYARGERFWSCGCPAGVRACHALEKAGLE